MKTAAPIPKVSSPSRPAWEVVQLFPNQGQWSVGDYLLLSGRNSLVEFDNGTIEVLPMPSMIHQLIVKRLAQLLESHVLAQHLGMMLFAPFRIRLWQEKFREPDLMFMQRHNASRMNNEYWDGADLVMEVVSDDDRRRDLETKRFEYAQAGIPEYWIVDPQRKEITVLTLADQRYEIHGIFTPGQKATSKLLGGFEVAVADVLAAP